MRGDNAKLRRLDKAMGWVDPEDGSSPASIAEQQGVASHIIGDHHGLPVVVWESDGVFSYCVLNRYRFLTATLLGRSKIAVIVLLRKLQMRVNSESDAKYWQPYYSAMWERRYRRWCCKRSEADPNACECQLCRIARSQKTKR